MIFRFRVLSGPMKGHKFMVRVNSSRQFAIGRSRNSTICIYDDRFVSRNHARIYVTPKTLLVEDSNSTNGTYLEGQRIRSRAPFPIGAQLLMGNSLLLYEGF